MVYTNCRLYNHIIVYNYIMFILHPSTADISEYLFVYISDAVQADILPVQSFSVKSIVPVDALMHKLSNIFN